MSSPIIVSLLKAGAACARGVRSTGFWASSLTVALLLAAPNGRAQAPGGKAQPSTSASVPGATNSSPKAATKSRKRQTYGKAAVASEHPLVTRTAFSILEQGGNAVDAAVAAALMAGVVAPSSSGLGGGGFALVHVPNTAKPVALDFREVAPRALDVARLEERPLPPEQRGALVGVPGEAMGLEQLHRRLGRLSFAKLVAPAEQRARLGFPVGAHMARTLSGSSPELRRDPALASQFFPGGRAALLGQVVKNPKLGKTLARLAKEGAQILYSGPIASEIARTVQAHGGRLDEGDLAKYSVIEREPLQVTWGDHEVFSMPPPSAGGLLLGQTLGLFSREELVRLAGEQGTESGAYQHVLAEAFRAALVARFAHVGDPAQVGDPTSKLLDPSYLKTLKQRIAIDRTHSIPLLASEEHGTHHMAFADAQGMVVSLTTTVNRTFGAKLVTPDSGLVLNDELDDFTLTKDLVQLGLRNAPNAPRPGARPTSSMTPTIVLRRGQPVLAIGGSGGMTIGPNVTQLLVARLAFGKSPNELVESPRIYVPTYGTDTLLADAGFPNATLDDLTFRGERVSPMRWTGSAVQVLSWDQRGWSAAADARKFGEAIAR